MKEPLLEGFLRGAGVVVFLLIVIGAYMAIRRLMHRVEPPHEELSEPARLSGSDRFIKAVTSCGMVAAGGFFVLSLLYLYVIGFHQYDGTVQQKPTDQIGGKQPRMLYFVAIQGINYQIDQSFYEVVNIGDHLQKPLLRPWVSVNGRKVWLEDTIRNGGFWLGFIGTACVVMCCWVLASAFRPPSQADPTQ